MDKINFALLPLMMKYQSAKHIFSSLGNFKESHYSTKGGYNLIKIHRKSEQMQRNKKKSFGQFDKEFIDQMKEVSIFDSLEDNKKFLEELFDSCSDFVIREFEIEKGIPALAAFVDGLINTELVNDTLHSLMLEEGDETEIKKLNTMALPVSQTQKANNYKDLLLSILGGDTAIFLDKNCTAELLGIRGAQTRSISEPETESVIRGPREGFVESLRTNTSMVRRKIKTPRLKMKSMTVGKLSNTGLVISYIEGIADPATVKEVEKRIQKINIDGILESGYIEELIQDNTYSPFPQVQYTERPDGVAAALLNGRIAVFIDGTPFVLVVPTVFWDLMSATEDYYERFIIGTLIRWLRYLFLLLALLTPALYVAAISFHQDLIPTNLLLSIAAAREAIPFPAVIEALIMEIAFEALREAGVRLPKTIGQAVSILGALVIGQAAVEAGIVSAPMVIVVSLTGIASFTIPRFNGAIAIRMLRFPFLLAASLFGIFGIIMVGIVILGHMAGLRSFGIPYLAPSAPMNFQDMKDIFMRPPWWSANKRPEFLEIGDSIREGDNLQEEFKENYGQTGQNIQHKGEKSE
jgi:spore germination protein